VAEAIILWLEQDGESIITNPTLREKVRNFASQKIAPDLPQLSKSIKSRLAKDRRRSIPVLPVPNDLSASEFDAIQVANQISLLDWYVFSSVQTKDFLGKPWLLDLESHYPHLYDMHKQYQKVFICLFFFLIDFV